MKKTVQIYFFEEEQENARSTYQLLHQISSHLSYRAGFVNTEYTVELRKDGVRLPGGCPQVRMTLHDGASVKENLLEHVLKHHLKATSVESVSNNEFSFTGFQVVPGVYKYRQSMSNKMRRWFSIF